MATPKASASPETLPPAAARTRRLSYPLWLLVGFATIALLYVAHDFFIPLVAGVTLAYMLRPAVDFLVVLRLPRALAALVVVLTMLGSAGYLMYELRDDTARLLETMPKAAKKIRVALQAGRETEQAGTLTTTVRETAKELDQAAAVASGQQTSAVQTGPSIGTRLTDYVVAQSITVLGFLAQILFAALLAWYLLSEGDTFKLKILRMVGPQLSRRKITVRILEDMDRQVQRQMAALVFTNVLIGAATALIFWWFGMEQAALWGVVAGILHFVPYLGQAIMTIGASAAAYLQFSSVSFAAGVAFATLLLSITIGTVLMTWLQSRAGKVNTTVLFVAILFFGWLWGPWGLVLASPLVVIVKSLCDHVESFAPAAEFLAGRVKPVEPAPAGPSPDAAGS